jgi:hypothetical protein
MHPSAVGTAHDSRGAERGYSSYDQYGSQGPAEGQEQYGADYGDGEEGWSNVPESGYAHPDYQPEPDNAGYGQVSYPDVYDLGTNGHGGFPAPSGHPGVEYLEHPSFPNLPAHPAYGAPVAADYEQHAGYEQPGGYEQQAGYEQQGGYPAGYAETDYGAVDYRQAHQAQPPAAGPSHQDYGFQDYGDPRYDDPSFGDPAFEEAPYAGYGAPAQHYPEAGYDPGGYPQAGYSDGYDQGHGYGTDPGPGYPAGPGYAGGPGYQVPDPGQAGYVAAEYASGQFPAGVGTLGELPGGIPDPAATGMLDTSGMLDATGIDDHADLYNFHPGAGAEAGHAFADAPVGTLDSSGLAPGLSDTMIDGHAPILDPAEAADHNGVLDGGTASTYFAGALGGATAAPVADPAQGTGAIPAFTDLEPAEITSLDMPAATAFDRAPADDVSGAGASRTGGTGALLRPRSNARPAGRRRGGSGDRRLWFALGGVLVVAAVAITAIVMVAFPSGPGGPAHRLSTPQQIGSFVRRPALEQQMNVSQLRQDVVSMSSGQASHVVEGVYEAGNSNAGSTPQIVLLIGGNLANASPVDSVASFTKRFKGATITSAGALGGKAVCVNATASEPGSVAMCAWFDNDSFGEVVSPTMKASQLAGAMRQIRPKVEQIVPKTP